MSRHIETEGVTKESIEDALSSTERSEVSDISLEELEKAYGPVPPAVAHDNATIDE